MRGARQPDRDDLQEPMVSLNPLHTWKNISTSAVVTPGNAQTGGARGDPRPPGARRDPSGAAAAGGLSASALRRRAPAGDDRHGAANSPEPLIADEPTHRPDVSVQAQISQLLRELKQGAEHGAAVYHS